MCQICDKRGYPVSVVKAATTTQKENIDYILFNLKFHLYNHAVESIILKTLNYVKAI